MIARLLPKDLTHRTLVLVTPKPSQLTIRWTVTHATRKAVQLVNAQTGRRHDARWPDIRQWLQEGKLRYDVVV